MVYAVSQSTACGDIILPHFSLVSEQPRTHNAVAMETLHVCHHLEWPVASSVAVCCMRTWSRLNSLLDDEFRIWREKKYSRHYVKNLICQVTLENQPSALKGCHCFPTNWKGSSINVWPFWKRLPKPLWPEVKYSFRFLPKYCRTNQLALAVASAPHHQHLAIWHTPGKFQVPPFSEVTGSLQKGLTAFFPSGSCVLSPYLNKGVWQEISITNPSLVVF